MAVKSSAAQASIPTPNPYITWYICPIQNSKAQILLISICIEEVKIHRINLKLSGVHAVEVFEHKKVL